MKKNKKTQTASKLTLIITFIICIGIGVLAGIMLPKYFDAVSESIGTPIALVILILYAIISFYAAIILHEGGHLIFGLLTGYRFSSFRIGSFMLVKTGGKLKFKLHSVAGTGGQCLLAPPDMKDGKIPYVLYNLGGVISNIFFSAVFALLAFLTKSNVYTLTLFIALALINLALGVSNGIPISTASVDNDGKNALSLGKNPAALRALWIQLKINSETAEGKRLSEMPDDWFRMPKKSDLCNALIASIISFRINRFMDIKDFGTAKNLIEEYKNEPSLPGIYKALMTMDLITVKAIEGAEYREIANLFTKDVNKIMTVMKKFPSVIRTKYVFALLAEESGAGAKSVLDTFEKVKKTYPYPVDIAAEGEIMEIAKQKFEERKIQTEE